MLSRQEFLLICKMDKAQIFDRLRMSRMKMSDALLFRRDIQVALTDYSKRNTYDEVQDMALDVTLWIEKWCRLAYMSERVAKIKRLNPNRKPDGIKEIVKKEWEDLLRKASY